MTDYEICRSYRNADDKRIQVNVIHELSLLPVTYIKNVLAENGLIKNDREEILKQYLQKNSPVRIARDLNVSHSYVCQVLRENGHGRWKKNKVDHSLVHELFNKGTQKAEIARQLCITRVTVNNILREVNL